jgi:hypothetical protein
MRFLPGFPGLHSIEMTGLEGLNYPINKSTNQQINLSTHRQINPPETGRHIKSKNKMGFQVQVQS